MPSLSSSVSSDESSWQPSVSWSDNGVELQSKSPCSQSSTPSRMLSLSSSVSVASHVESLS